jgi:DNA polymerase-3 subunit beta
MKLSIQHDVIKALLIVAGKKDIRYYLNSVCIDARANGDIVLVSCDGYRMLAYPVSVDDIEYADGEPVFVGKCIIPRDPLEVIKPMKKNGKGSFPITVTLNREVDRQDPERSDVTIKGEVTIEVKGTSTITTRPVDGEYPDWRRIMPAKVSGEPAQYNAEYVGDFGKVCVLMGNKLAAPLINHNGTGAAVITNLGRAIGILMPLRMDPDFTSMPSWAKS